MALAIVVCNAFINAGLLSFTGSYEEKDQKYADWTCNHVCTGYSGFGFL